MNPSQSRRTKVRIPVLIPAGIYRPDRPNEPVDAEIRNISLGGAFVHCRVPMQINQELMIEIRFGEGKVVPIRVTETSEEPPPAPGLESALSRVRWTQEKAAEGFGVEFSNLGPDARAYLETLLRYFEKLARAGVTF